MVQSRSEMRRIMDKFIEYIEESVNALEKEEKELAAGERKDEANLVKIRINIYGIARSFYDVVKNSAAPDSIAQEFRRRIEKPAQSWRASHEKAKEHNDVEKCVIEEIKLKTLEDIIEKINTLYPKEG